MKLRIKTGSLAVACLIWIFATRLAIAPAQQVRRPTTPADVERWMKELSNWGRWGKDDQLGAINLITAGKRRYAAGLVREGLSVSLSRAAEKEKAIDNPSPFGHAFTATGMKPMGPYSIDAFTVSYHGFAHTHLDALCHMFYKGQMYNGFSQQEVTTKGAGRLAVLNLKNGLVTRGVLMDIPRLRGRAYLEAGTPVYPEDLDAWEREAGVRVTSGDAVFIRTGRWALRAAKGPWDIGNQCAGLHASCARWLKNRDAALLGSDTGSEVIPSGIPGVPRPVHQLVLIAMGMPMFDNCDLEALSETAGRPKRWEFLLTAAPLAVPGATGSPVNPIATF
jgi:kynurenine formamidase